MPESKKKSDKNIGVRFKDDDVARIDALKPVFSSPWYEATRSDVIRALVLGAIKNYENAAKPQAKRRDA